MLSIHGPFFLAGTVQRRMGGAVRVLWSSHSGSLGHGLATLAPGRIGGSLYRFWGSAVLGSRGVSPALGISSHCDLRLRRERGEAAYGESCGGTVV